MAFLRKKTTNGKDYWYLVEGYRGGGKVKQRVLKYIGKKKPSPEELEKIKGGLIMNHIDKASQELNEAMENCGRLIEKYVGVNWPESGRPIKNPKQSLTKTTAEEYHKELQEAEAKIEEAFKKLLAQI